MSAALLLWRTACQARSYSVGLDTCAPAATVTWRDVEKASRSAAGRLVQTPLLESRLINGLVGGRVLVKAESLQHGGSFKMRGALNKLFLLGDEQRGRGVVTFSSGNFAQGLALAALELGVHATIVMPDDAPLPKVERTRYYGADVVFSTPAHAGENREVAADRMARALAEKHGYTLLHPFNDDDVIVGQGTAAWEIAIEAKRRGIEQVDSLLVCCGGGGLVSGCSIAMLHHFPSCEVIPVEPEGYNGAGLSLAGGAVTSVQDTPASICDSLQAPAPGELPFRILQAHCKRGIGVSDVEAARAMKVAFDSLKLVLEPGGAVALAAVLEGKVEIEGKVTAVVASGGNVAWGKFLQVLEEA